MPYTLLQKMRLVFCELGLAIEKSPVLKLNNRTSDSNLCMLDDFTLLFATECLYPRYTAHGRGQSEISPWDAAVWTLFPGKSTVEATTHSRCVEYLNTLLLTYWACPKLFHERRLSKLTNRTTHWISLYAFLLLLNLFVGFCWTVWKCTILNVRSMEIDWFSLNCS